MDSSVRTMGGYIISMEQPRTPILLLKASHFSCLLCVFDNTKKGQKILLMQVISAVKPPWSRNNSCRLTDISNLLTLTFDKKKKKEKNQRALYQGYKWLQIPCLGEAGERANICLKQICYCQSFHQDPSPYVTSSAVIWKHVASLSFWLWFWCVYCSWAENGMDVYIAFRFRSPHFTVKCFPFQIDMDVGDAEIEFCNIKASS